jgi:thioredoxin 1
MNLSKVKTTVLLKGLVVVALVAAVAVAIYAKRGGASQEKPGSEAVTAAQANIDIASSPANPTAPSDKLVAVSSAVAQTPRLLDLGSDKCKPCKMMIPVLDELKTEYAGRLTVDFIDVWKDPNAGDQYKISLIPTQIFFDASGKELFRHEGFFSKEDILAQWAKLGVDLSPKNMQRN